MEKTESTQSPQRRKPKIKPDSETVFIGFKAEKELKSGLEQASGRLGLTPSQFLRALAADAVEKMDRIPHENT